MVMHVPYDTPEDHQPQIKAIYVIIFTAILMSWITYTLTTG